MTRTRTLRLLSLVALLVLFAAACTGGGEEPTAEPGTEDGAEVEATEPEATEGGATEAAAGGDAEAVAQAWLEDNYDAAVVESLEPTGVDGAMGVSHVTYTQTVDGVPVDGAEIVVHVLADGTVQNATDSLTDAAPDDGAQDVDETGAIDFAEKAVTGEPTGDSAAELVYIQDGTDLHLAWRVDVATDNPDGSWTVFVDAADGSVISAEETATNRWGGHRGGPYGNGPAAWIGASVGQGAGVAQAAPGEDACAVEASPGACIFLVDPLYSAGLQGAELTDPNEANTYLTPVELQGLSDPTVLTGEYANAAPDGSPVEPVSEDDGTWATGRAGRGFEDAMAYYWIDYTQRLIQGLGITDVRNESFPIFPLDPEVVDNAFYSPAEQAVHMGVGSDGLNESEDASGIIHEYGHAVLDFQVPGLLGGAEGGAYHESFGDLLAYLTTLEYRAGDAGCLFPWVESGSCLRRIDSPKVYPDDLENEVHADGEIYNGAIYDVLVALLGAQGVDIGDCAGSDVCNETRDRVLATMLVGNGYLPDDAGLQSVAESFILANEAAYAAADAELITEAFAARGLAGGGGDMVDPGGEPMGPTGGVSVGVDIGHSYRGDLEVTVGVTDSSHSDICEPLVLFTPDETDDADNLSGIVDVSDTDCAALVPPGPEQIWYLQVVDTLAEDEGVILGFTVYDGDVPYNAPGLPLPIADADPAGTFALVDGSGEDVAAPGSETVGDPVSGDGPSIDLAITHTYIGDLQIAAGVADAEGTIICSVSLQDTDPTNSEADLSGSADMSGCAEFYPPSPDQQWYLQVIDTAAVDEGTVDQFMLNGPDGQTFDFAGVPVDIPDADPDGVALLLNGSGGSSGTAGGTGQGSTMGLPAVQVSITHPYRGDLAVTAGVLGPDGSPLCEVVVSTPNPEDSEAAVVSDTSLEDCAEFYPPTAEQPWYVFAADTLEVDTGTLDSVTLAGPDGVSYTAADLPAELPDGDPNGVVAIIDGSEGMTSGGGTGAALVSYVISHPYVGDLDVITGVADASGNIMCSVEIATADLSNNTVDLFGEVDVSDCVSFYPPSADALWFLQAVDTAEVDEGTIDAAVLVGPDGQVFAASGVPAPIPDADPTGTAVLMDVTG